MKNKKINFRLATLDDATNIAKLHVQNWQTTYRSSWSDNFLDNIAPKKQLEVWTQRLIDATLHILLAEAENQLTGFACTELNADPVYGSLLDNLHVAADWRGHRIGKQLTLTSMDWVRKQNAQSGYFLWVLEKNLHARKFYKMLGGEEVETVIKNHPERGGFSVVRCAWKVGF